MRMKACSTDGTLAVRIEGEVDHHSAREIREEVDRMIAEGRPKTLLLELDGIDFMDSSGLGLVLGRYRRMLESGGKTVIRNPSARTEKILRMAGVDKLMRIVKEDKEKRKEG